MTATGDRAATLSEAKEPQSPGPDPRLFHQRGGRFFGLVERKTTGSTGRKTCSESRSCPGRNTLLSCYGGSRESGRQPEGATVIHDTSCRSRIRLQTEGTGFEPANADRHCPLERRGGSANTRPYMNGEDGAPKTLRPRCWGGGPGSRAQNREARSARSSHGHRLLHQPSRPT